MTYLTRPVFLFPIQWADAIERTVTLDLREQLLGFGAEFFTPTQLYTVNGWAFSLYLRAPADFLAFETFCDGQVGRLNGFWLPCPLKAAQFLSGVSNTQFIITGEGLSDTWNNRPDQHLFFTFPDGTQAAAQISGVVNNGDGTETVTMASALPGKPGAGTLIQRLHYVRFGADAETYEFDAENVGVIKLSVVELPLEYTAAATGLQPVYLYHLWADAPVRTDWYFTSFAAGVVSAGVLYQPFPMTHTAIKHSLDGNSNQVQVEAEPSTSHPFAMLSGTPPGRPLWIQILVCYLGAPDTQTILFAGYVTSVKDDGQKLTANCDTRLAWLKTKLPRFLVGSQCNWNLFDPNTCKVPRAVYETTVTIATFNPGAVPIVTCAFNYAFQLANWQTTGWFTGGILETGAGSQYEVRSIIGSSWDSTTSQLWLTLNQALKFAVVGQLMEITAGCDHTSAGPNGCIQKFNNLKNFGGFVAVPQRNLSLTAVDSSVAMGGKGK